MVCIITILPLCSNYVYIIRFSLDTGVGDYDDDDRHHNNNDESYDNLNIV